MTPFVSLWVLFLKAFQSDMKNTAVIQSISLLPDFTQFFFSISHLPFTFYAVFLHSLSFSLIFHPSLLLYFFLPFHSHFSLLHFTPSYLTVDGSLQFWVASFIKLDAWEEVLNQAQEERLILIDLTNTHKCTHRHMSKTHTKMLRIIYLKSVFHVLVLVVQTIINNQNLVLSQFTYCLFFFAIIFYY